MSKTTKTTPTGLDAWMNLQDRGAAMSPLDSPTYLIGHLGMLISRRFNREYFAELGINAPEFKLVALLGLKGPLSHRALAEGSDMDKAQVSRTVGRLLDGGLIALTGENTTTQRIPASAAAELTQTGRQVFEKAMEIGRQRQIELLELMTEEERAVLYRVLHRLIEAEKART